MLELFGPHIERGLGFDLSVDMLAFARARLDRAGLRHCSVRQGDIYDLALANDSFDAVVIHQVLHFLDDGARAVVEAARVLRAGGRLLVVDFAPHDLEFLREEHAHRRLGFASETVTEWMKSAGLTVSLHRTLAPQPEEKDKIAVSLWLGRDPRILVAQPLHLPGRSPSHSRLLRVLSSQDRGDGNDSLGIHHPACAARTEFRFRHLWGGRLHA
jgi:SAM-dependent methyltransferase